MAVCIACAPSSPLIMIRSRCESDSRIGASETFKRAQLRALNVQNQRIHEKKFVANFGDSESARRPFARSRRRCDNSRTRARYFEQRKKCACINRFLNL
jgi:hypothetical protein